jgi:drug/metabolite transporter (DMT)-like permease
VLSRWGLERGWLPPSARARTLWSLAAGALLIGAAGLVVESPGSLLSLNRSDWLILAYLGVVSSGATFWLMQRATEVLTPGAVMAYTYLTPFVSIALLIVETPSLLDWRWLPGSVLVLVAIFLLQTPERVRWGLGSRWRRRAGPTRPMPCDV